MFLLPLVVVVAHLVSGDQLEDLGGTRLMEGEEIGSMLPAPQINPMMSNMAADNFATGQQQQMSLHPNDFTNFFTHFAFTQCIAIFNLEKLLLSQLPTSIPTPN